MLHRSLTTILLALSLPVFLLALSHIPSSQAFASGSTGPRYTWASFGYGWNRNAPEKIQLTQTQPIAEGYVADFGFTNTLTIYVDSSVVTGTCARFIGGGENDAGGNTFRHLIANSINMGSFRWPQEQLNEVRAAFQIISMQPKEYTYNTTRFTFDYNPASGWEFCMTYLPK